MEMSVLQRLMALNMVLMGDGSVIDKIQEISKVLREIMGYERCSIFVHDDKKSRFWTVHADGASTIEVPDDKGIVGACYREREPLVIDDVSQSEFFYAEIDKQTSFKTRSIVAVPIFGYDNHCLGVVELINQIDEERTVTEDDLKTVRFAINHVVTFVEMVVSQQ